MDPNLRPSIDFDFINSYGYQFGSDLDDAHHQPYQTLLDHDHAAVQQVEASSAPITSDPSLEDFDFSETVKFISQILMEENVEQRPFYDPLSLQLTENSFYQVLNEDNNNNNNIPFSPNEHPLDTATTTSNNNSSDSGEPKHPSVHTPVSSDHDAFEFNSNPPSNSIGDLESSITKLLAQNMFSDSDSVSQFKRGLEEASKFLPPSPQILMGSLESDRMDKGVELKSRKNHEREESDTQEGRSNKQSAINSGGVDESELSDMFDGVLLYVGNLPICDQQKPSSDEGGRKIRTKKQSKKKETIDLRTLLILCAQPVSANDNRTANELLKQIRQHSSPSGDASQRMAHYFANGLEARLVGDGSAEQGSSTFLSYKRITAVEYLKAYQVLVSACPFKKFAHFFANKMIMKAAIKAESLHIIDFGILYGFQWPILIKFLSEREGGPPKLKITGIEFPLPGFRPAERIEETGLRLAKYCERFKVPFEYNAIASRNWETIQVEDLQIESNQLLVVNCFMRFKNLLDETIEVNSPKNGVLHLIRKINPDIFVQSIVNGSYNAPFFTTRFREALFHFSAIYDMCDTVIPRENERRRMMEGELVGREVMNVVACEGLERVERPETYKHWQVRNTRAGFKQLPLNEELMAKFKAKLRDWYHRDFVFDEDNNWMLQGWKGRILYASTCWVPA